jgi:uncharacterized membrane protein YvbJ
MILKIEYPYTPMDCPVCGNDNDENVTCCSRCGTDFSFLKTKERNGDHPVNDVRKDTKEEEESD